MQIHDKNTLLNLQRIERIATLYIYLSKVLTERFSILYKTQTKQDIRFYILTLVLVDIHFTFSAKVWIQL